MGCDPVGYLGFCSARSVIARAADVERTARLKIQGPSGRRMNRLDFTGLGGQSQRSGRDTEKPRGFVEIQPRFDSVVGGFVDGNTVVRAQRCYALTGPAVAVAGHQSVPVQDAGNESVVSDQHELAYRGNHVGRRCCCAARAGVWAGVSRCERRRSNGPRERSRPPPDRYRRSPPGSRCARCAS